MKKADMDIIVMEIEAEADLVDKGEVSEEAMKADIEMVEIEIQVETDLGQEEEADSKGEVGKAGLEAEVIIEITEKIEKKAVTGKEITEANREDLP